MAVSQRDTAEFEPRRRIIGAIILVTLAFVVFSLVLQDKPANRETAEPESAPDTQVVVAPVPGPSVAPSRETAASSPSAQTQHPPASPAAKPTAPASSPSVPAQQPAPEAKPKPETAKPTPAPSPAATGNWLVQVGTFSEPANARRLGEKLKAIHYEVRLKVVTLDKGRAVRVQAGPFASKTRAVAARNDIEKRLGLRGVVLARK
jgi:DedD protein